MVKKKAGQPTKYNAKVKKQCIAMVLKAFTDAEMADILGITEQTLNNWKKAHPKFFESLKDAKAEADRSVAKSLYERACGFECPTETLVSVGKDGKEIEIKRTKFLPPDPTSMIFWLKNRQPKEWKDKHDLKHTGKDGGPIEIISAIPEPIKLVEDTT